MDFSREEAKGADTGLEGGEVGGVRSSARWDHILASS